MAFSISTARAAAEMAAGGFLLLTVFQASLALGAPLGRAAWGGIHGDVLPPGLRIASAFVVVVFVAAAFVVLGHAGRWRTTVPFGVFRWGTWTLAALMALSALANFASSSNWERFLWGPVALLLALLCLVVALGEGVAGR